MNRPSKQAPTVTKVHLNHATITSRHRRPSSLKVSKNGLTSPLRCHWSKLCQNLSTVAQDRLLWQGVALGPSRGVLVPPLLAGAAR
jgi:hypothetical protein